VLLVPRIDAKDDQGLMPKGSSTEARRGAATGDRVASRAPMA